MSMSWWIGMGVLTVLPVCAVVVGFIWRDWAEIALVGGLTVYVAIAVVVYAAAAGDDSGRVCIRENKAGRCVAFEQVPHRSDPRDAGDEDIQTANQGSGPSLP